MRHLRLASIPLLFLPALQGFCSLAGKIIFAGLITWLAFGKGLLKRMVFNAILFLIVTFLYGGITIAAVNRF